MPRLRRADKLRRKSRQIFVEIVCISRDTRRVACGVHDIVVATRGLMPSESFFVLRPVGLHSRSPQANRKSGISSVEQSLDCFANHPSGSTLDSYGLVRAPRRAARRTRLTESLRVFLLSDLRFAGAISRCTTPHHIGARGAPFCTSVIRASSSRDLGAAAGSGFWHLPATRFTRIHSWNRLDLGGSVFPRSVGHLIDHAALLTRPSTGYCWLETIRARASRLEAGAAPQLYVVRRARGEAASQVTGRIVGAEELRGRGRLQEMWSPLQARDLPAPGRPSATAGTLGKRFSQPARARLSSPRRIRGGERRDACWWVRWSSLRTGHPHRAGPSAAPCTPAVLSREKAGEVLEGGAFGEGKVSTLGDLSAALVGTFLNIWPGRLSESSHIADDAAGAILSISRRRTSIAAIAASIVAHGVAVLLIVVLAARVEPAPSYYVLAYLVGNPGGDAGAGSRGLGASLVRAVAEAGGTPALLRKSRRSSEVGPASRRSSAAPASIRLASAALGDLSPAPPLKTGGEPASGRDRVRFPLPVFREGGPGVRFFWRRRRFGRWWLRCACALWRKSCARLSRAGAARESAGHGDVAGAGCRGWISGANRDCAIVGLRCARSGGDRGRADALAVRAGKAGRRNGRQLGDRADSLRPAGGLTAGGGRGRSFSFRGRALRRGAPMTGSGVGWPDAGHYPE